MNASTMTTLITDTISTFGTSLVTILGAVIGVGVAYLVFRFGWKKVKGSTSDGIFNRAQSHFGYKLDRKYYFRGTSFK